MSSRVVVANCPSYSSSDVARALAELMESIGGLSSFVAAGQTVLVKPNLFSPHDPDDAVTTHPELVRQVVQLCFESGAGRVWVGDSPVGVHNEKDLWARTGMNDAVEGTRAELKSWRVKHVPIACDDDVLVVPEWLSQVDAVISLPKLKTHCLTTLTCGLKNVYGIVSGQAKGQFHTKYASPQAMSGFLVRVYSKFKPALTIVDAVVAMEGNGPSRGDPLPIGVLMAGGDAVAIDAVACAPLRIAPARVPMIRMGAAMGLGEMKSSNIECIGSGLDRLRAARMKHSLSRLLNMIPEWAFAKKLRLYRMRPDIRRGLCVKCGMCAGACPRGAIGAGPAGFPVIDKAACIDCFCCLESCPQSAIAVQYSFCGLLRYTRNKRATVDRA